MGISVRISLRSRISNLGIVCEQSIGTGKRTNVQTDKHSGTCCFCAPYAISGIGYSGARQSGGDAVLYRRYFLHHRMIREAVTAVVTIGAALLLSYLILQARF
jgi:hypothetical protein